MAELGDGRGVEGRHLLVPRELLRRAHVHHLHDEHQEG